MAIRIPQNQIKKELYTSGGEFLIAKTQQRYKGYYYEANGKFYAGKEYKNDSPELIKSTSDKVNNLLSNPFTYLYGAISQIKLNNTKLTSHIYKYDSDKRYFSYNTTTKIIKEIDKDNFDLLQSNPIYTTVTLSFIGGFNDNEVNEAEKRIPGIKTFTENSYIPPSVEDDGTIG